MKRHTLIFDANIESDDVEHYEGCAGVVGVTGFENTITLHYAQPLTERELESLAHAVMAHKRLGINLQFSDVRVMEDERITTDALKAYLVY